MWGKYSATGLVSLSLTLALVWCAIGQAARVLVEAGIPKVTILNGKALLHLAGRPERELTHFLHTMDLVYFITIPRLWSALNRRSISAA